jgi:uncharacterized membrane protein
MVSAISWDEPTLVPRIGKVNATAEFTRYARANTPRTREGPEGGLVNASVEPLVAQRLHPLHAFFLSAMVPLFLGAALSDYAYTSTFQIQWSNFASWLIAGGLVFGACALLCDVLDLGRLRRAGRSFELIVLALTWILGLVNAFVHARDAWAVMPTGFALSIVVFLLAALATWLGLVGVRRRIGP